jgi:hypothetical protein
LSCSAAPPRCSLGFTRSCCWLLSAIEFSWLSK